MRIQGPKLVWILGIEGIESSTLLASCLRGHWISSFIVSIKVARVIYDLGAYPLPLNIENRILILVENTELLLGFKGLGQGVLQGCLMVCNNHLWCRDSALVT